MDGAHGSNGNAHFYFLKPLVTPPASFPGTFDPTQAPNVEICQWNATTAGVAECWGANEAGQLGTGSATTNFPYGIPSPTQVTGSLTFLTP